MWTVTTQQWKLQHLNKSIWISCVPVVANVMLTVLAPQEDGLKLWWVVEIPPVQVEVGLRVLGLFVSSCQNFKRTNQLQTQRVFQRTCTD